MIHDVFMPGLNYPTTPGTVVEWAKFPGDKIDKGEKIVAVKFDKVDVDVESDIEGYLAVIIVEAGQEAPVGSAIALIAETEAEIVKAQKLRSSREETTH